MRNTDRLITPGVVIVGILVGGACVLATILGVAWLTARGLDPDPMLRLLAQAVAAIGALGTFVLQLANNARSAKTERNTGVLANGVYELADQLPQKLPPVPPSRHQAPDDTTAYSRAAPAPQGS